MLCLGAVLIWDVVKGDVLHHWAGAAQGGPGKYHKVVTPFQQLILLSGHSRRVNNVAFNHDGSILYSCSDDKQVLHWNVKTGTAAG